MRTAVPCACGRPKVARSPICGRCRERRERCPICSGVRRGRYWCATCALALTLANQVNALSPGRRPPPELREALIAHYRGRAERGLPLFEELTEADRARAERGLPSFDDLTEAD